MGCGASAPGTVVPGAHAEPKGSATTNGGPHGFVAGPSIKEKPSVRPGDPDVVLVEMGTEFTDQRGLEVWLEDLGVNTLPAGDASLGADELASLWKAVQTGEALITEIREDMWGHLGAVLDEEHMEAVKAKKVRVLVEERSLKVRVFPESAPGGARSLVLLTTVQQHPSGRFEQKAQLLSGSLLAGESAPQGAARCILGTLGSLGLQPHQVDIKRDSLLKFWEVRAAFPGVLFVRADHRIDAVVGGLPMRVGLVTQEEGPTGRALTFWTWSPLDMADVAAHMGSREEEEGLGRTES
eukprot:CAMPEP_0182899418 /NCGR_PEP_ID=MMETSP0034_2-20130328/28064_1 /TAXON_ID=156128 /ORGANISM="Nephroselmis pyriformis, Strain CCMP717" /LENGTH=295 /DNA_ID=CAMNT_0025033447 /DNA_START=382 /DNA_END=1265 /DNA_ORIENTATION=-